MGYKFNPIAGHLDLVNPSATATGGGGSYSAGISTLGNTSGTTGMASNRLVLAGGNNVTLSQSINGGSATITISAFNQSVQTQNMVSLLGSTGDISFANSNGITFGGNNSTITASHNGLTSQSNQAFEAGGVSSAFQTLSFQDSNGVSFSNNAGAIRLTHGLQYTSNTSQITVNAVNVTDARVRAILANGATLSTGSVGLRDLNGVSFLTTTGNSIQLTHDLQYTSNTSNITSNALHTTAPRINLSAGTTSNNLSNFVMSNSNGLTFGLNGSTITGSHNGITSQTNQNVSLYGLGNTTQNSSTVLNASNLSFNAIGSLTVGYSNGSIQLSAPSALTSQSNQAFSAGAASSAFQTLSFQDSNGVSFSNNAGAIRVTHDLQFTSATSAITSNALNTSASRVINLVAATNNTGGGTASLSSNISFSNANNISFYTSAGNAIVGSVNTSYRASNDAVGLNTAQTNVTWTVNSSGISLNAGGYAGTGTSITGGASVTLNSNGLQFNGTALAGTGTTFNGTNLSASMTLNTAGLRLDMSAGAGGANPAASASNGSFTFQTLGFSNANNVTFGTSAGSIITASVAAPGAAAENNWVNLLGANTAGNTTVSGSTIGVSGINLTLSGTNGSAWNISAPATSSLSATGGIQLSTNGSTISIGNSRQGMFEPIPVLHSGSNSFLPGIGSWYFVPFNLNSPIGGGRINVLQSYQGTASLFGASNGTSFASGTTGGASYSFAISRSIALYSLGAGANSTRLESFWSSQNTMGGSHSMGLSLTNASQLTGQRQLSIGYIASIGSDGGTTGGGVGATHNASFANSSTATSAYTSAMSSIYNMISGAVLLPVPFNTTINPGYYALAMAYSTASTTAGTSVNGASIMTLVNQVGVIPMTTQTYRQFGQTAVSSGSMFRRGLGMYSAVSADAPATVAFTDLRSFASNNMIYFNIDGIGMSV